MKAPSGSSIPETKCSSPVSTPARTRKDSSASTASRFEGMISMVVATEQPICENEVYKNARQDKEVDQKARAPHLRHDCCPPRIQWRTPRRYLLSCKFGLEIRQDPDPPGFTQEHLVQIQLAATSLGRLLEARLLSHCLGFTSIS